ncbi:MAG: TRAP dicarboxylate transporter, DctM subunit, unknown substrate 3 [uncultured Acetobacteraceae bacterium]|jgi:C4-dicarboxylate transporter DctM subunit|uniref:TRAP transporter large permease protein n=1 Tax=uncultured Acetobacteraceae bacterium TaxID=169975 RepID=A0A6J4I031_9PROT|nr:MAG: TRAP dicarboxylate transporter, DctM subunit, unknown substrate 3 [uncultured Acetobacteraceae bacterium]
MPQEFAIAAAGFAVLLVLVALRAPVGLAMLLVGAGGYLHIVDATTLLSYLKTTPYHLFASYTLSVIPLFILMGALAERGGLARDLFDATNALFGRKPGGMAMGVIGASAVFGAVCGSSVATTATIGRAALPELKRFGYDPGLATGTVAVGGTLGILIPPSVILVVYAISTEQNIAKLFMAAMGPGLLAAVFYVLAIAVLTRLRPALAPPGAAVGAAEKRRAMLNVIPVLLISAVVIGGIYGGVFTPTESAAVGCVATLAVGLARRTLSGPDLREALLATAETTAMIFVILLGAEVFNAFLALSQAPDLLALWITEQGFPPYGVLALLLFAYIILGAVMDELAMILLTLPIFFPMVTALDFGLGSTEETAIWFGVLVLVVVGIGLTAPPIGLNVFVVSSLARDVPIAQTYRGVLPFLATDLVRLALLVAFPALSLWLVRMLT